MKKLEDLLGEIEYSIIRGDTEGIEVTKIVNDTRGLEERCLFVCITGANFDGHDFAEEAVNKGAKVIVTEKDVALPDDTVVTVV